jgi:hypothetical protein
MKQLQQLYRSTYQGENVVTDLTLKNKQWNITQTWIGNSVINNQISNKACVIGNGISRKDFPIHTVINHFGGLLGTQKLQTYACNAFYREHTPDFLVVSGDDKTIIAEVANSGFCDQNVVYATAADIQLHPGNFYLIPQDPAWNSGSIATYLAAFDGHKTVALIGFDMTDTQGYTYNCYAGTNGYQADGHAQASSKFQELTMLEVFTAYPNVDFVRVMPTSDWSMPESWKYVTNLRQISFRDFVLEFDI